MQKYFSVVRAKPIYTVYTKWLRINFRPASSMFLLDKNSLFFNVILSRYEALHRVALSIGFWCNTFHRAIYSSPGLCKMTLRQMFDDGQMTLWILLNKAFHHAKKTSVVASVWHSLLMCLVQLRHDRLPKKIDSFVNSVPYRRDMTI